jgi:hypothetical protein
MFDNPIEKKSIYNYKYVKGSHMAIFSGIQYHLISSLISNIIGRHLFSFMSASGKLKGLIWS